MTINFHDIWWVFLTGLVFCGVFIKTSGWFADRFIAPRPNSHPLTNTLRVIAYMAFRVFGPVVAWALGLVCVVGLILAML